MMYKKQRGLILAAILAWPWLAQAAGVFGQTPADGRDGFPSISAEQSADNFTLDSSAQIDGMTWWGTYSADPAGLPADQFQIRLFQDNGAGQPQPSAFVTVSAAPTRTATALKDATGAVVYRYDLTLASPISLNAQTRYFLSVTNGFDVYAPKANWYWQQSDTTGSNFFRAADTDAWQAASSGNLAFALSAPTAGECLFNWAEKNYPGLFAPAASTVASGVYSYRYYSATKAYLGVSSADSHVYYLGADGQLQDEGPLSDWLQKAGCQASPPPPGECLFNWAERNYPGLFAPAGTTVVSGVYSYRYYSATKAYLGVSSADSHVYYLGQDGKLQDEGPLSYWLPLAGCQ